MFVKMLAAVAALAWSAAAGAAAPARVEITDRGLEPSNLAVPPGGELTFVNRGSQPHQIESDPHPLHTRCPWLNGKRLAPGESRTVKAPDAGQCTFHDHLHPNDPGLRGSVSVSR